MIGLAPLPWDPPELLPEPEPSRGVVLHRALDVDRTTTATLYTDGALVLTVIRAPISVNYVITPETRAALRDFLNQTHDRA